MGQSGRAEEERNGVLAAYEWSRERVKWKSGRVGEWQGKEEWQGGD